MRTSLSTTLLVALLSTLGAACAAPTDSKSGKASDGTTEEGNLSSEEGDGEGSGSDGSSSASSTPTAPAEAAPPATTTPATTTPETTCTAPRDGGTMAGDQAGTPLTLTGTCADWIRVRVTEASSSFSGEEMKITATLTSPAGEDFDLLGYVNVASDVVECATPKARSESTAADALTLTWGEDGTFSNGDEDGRTVMLQVKRKSGTGCSASPWSLRIEHP